VIIPDANLLIYAHNAADPDHIKALKWWRGLLQGREEVGIPMAVVMAFIRLTTSPRILVEPLSVQESSDLVLKWFEYDHIRILHAAEAHLTVFLRMIKSSGSGGNLTTDAHIAALAWEFRAHIHSADADFGRFSGIRWINPLK